MTRQLIFILLLFLNLSVSAQIVNEELVIVTPTGNLQGSLITPQDATKFPVVILLPGSGPTDRNGNNAMGVTANSYRLLAEALAKQKIATLLIDKRGIAGSAKAIKSEADIRFDDYANDAIAWKEQIEKDKRVTKIFIAGHSEGSLIGMLAAQKTKLSGYISISGPARSIDKIIVEQYDKQVPQMAKQVDSLFTRLKNNQPLDSVPPMYAAIFRKSVQPYMTSWMRYTPCTEIAKLTIPVMIIQGTNDIQVDSTEAVALGQCQPKALVHIIPGMNHILKNSSKNLQENFATYKKPDLPINDELITDISNFILKGK